MVGFSAALAVLPLVGFVFEGLTLWRLEESLASHEAELASHVARARIDLQQLGIDLPTVGPTFRNRPFFVYLAVSVVFIPVLAFWYYSMIRSMDDHLGVQARFEDAFAAATRKGK
jgi:hypothetical protein